MSEDVLEERGDYRVRIENDEDCEDPREALDGVMEIVTPHRRGGLGDSTDATFQSQHDRLYDAGYGGLFPRYMKIFHDITVVPVYKYEHSGVALSTGSFGDHWDSGMVGWAYVLPGMAWEGMDEEKFISGCIETLGQWLNGETYGYIVEQKVLVNKKFFDTDGNELPERHVIYHEWDEVDSCWGFIGYDYATDEALRVLESFAPKEEQVA